MPADRRSVFLRKEIFAWRRSMPRAHCSGRPGPKLPNWSRNFRVFTGNRRPHVSIINYASREIQFKIVYYGPALCGKTTNLNYIHQRINPLNRGELVLLEPPSHRPISFDLLTLTALTLTCVARKRQLRA